MESDFPIVRSRRNHSHQRVFKHLTVFGPGLLGASLAQTLKKCAPPVVVRLWGRDAVKIDRISREPWGEGATTDMEEALRDSEALILATPVPHFIPLLRQALPFLPSGCRITDVGSTKQSFMKELEAFVASSPLWKEKHLSFVGSHPMAGSEDSGWEAARPDLYQGCSCHLIPGPGASPKTVQTWADFWQSLGMRLLPPSTPAEHDRRVAQVSHLPHLLAATLAQSLAALPEDTSPFAGPGLRDTIRVAGGSPSLWRAIVSENRAAIIKAVEDFSGSFTTLQELLKEGDDTALEAFLAQGQAFQRRVADQWKEQNS
jgi:prephenate dehydrogenase